MTDLHNGCPSKTKTSPVRRVDDGVFCQSLAVQLSWSDAEKKPQLVTEVLPGLTELFQTQGNFGNFGDDLFFSFPP